MREQRDLRVNTEAPDLLGGRHRHFGNLLGARDFVDVRIADEQRAARQHQVIHRRQRIDARPLADDLIDDPQVMAELAGHAADQAIGVAKLQQHGADQRRLAAHRLLGDRRRDATADHQLVIGRPAFAVALVGFRIDDIEIDAGPDAQVGRFKAMLDDRRTTDQDRAGKFFFDHDLGGAQHALIFAFGKNDALALGLAGGLENGTHADTGVIDEFGELGAVGIPIGDRPGRDARINRRQGDCRCDLDDEARIERLRNQIFGPERTGRGRDRPSPLRR